MKETLGSINARIGKMPRSYGFKDILNPHAGGFIIFWDRIGDNWIMSAANQLEKGQEVRLQATDIIVYNTRKQIRAWIDKKQLRRHPNPDL